MKIFSIIVLAATLVAAVPVHTGISTPTSLVSINQRDIITPVPTPVLLDERSPAKKKGGHGGAFGKSSKAAPAVASPTPSPKAPEVQWSIAGNIPASVVCKVSSNKTVKQGDIRSALSMAIAAIKRNVPYSSRYDAKKKYPHYFGNKSGDNTVIPNVQGKLQEYPVILGGEAQFPNSPQGDYRVTYTQDDKTKTITFQGVIAHLKKEENGKIVESMVHCT